MDALLRQYKDKYGNVFLAEVGDQEFIFRELTRKEYRRIVEDTYGNDYGLEEAVCATAVLYPENYDFAMHGRAGTAKNLFAKILHISGFAHANQQVDALEYYRADMMSFESQAETVIQLVFPHVTEEEMDDWTQDRLMKKLARAEWVMREIWQMPWQFAKRDEKKEDEEAVEQEAPSIMEIAAEIREQGGDPMLVLKDQLIQRRDHNYVEFPIIGGTKLLQNEEVLENVRKQIQGLSK